MPERPEDGKGRRRGWDEYQMMLWYLVQPAWFRQMATMNIQRDVAGEL